MKVCVFRSQDGACDHYRAVLPMLAGVRRHLIQMKELWLQSIITDILIEPEKFAEGMQADVYLTQRLSGPAFIDRIRSFSKDVGMSPTIVVDFDDDMFNVSPLSGHYADHGTEEVKIVHNGQTIHEWKDGTNINIKANRKRIDDIKLSIEKCDLLTVTTDILASVYKDYTDKIAVLPNCLDLNSWNRLPIAREKKEEVRIVWAGGHSHFEDLLMIREPLIDIANKYPNVKILMLGYMPVSMEKGFRPGQVEFFEWAEFYEHAYRLAALDVDIGLIPLKDNVFNRSKSSIKWLEYSALKIPSVVSYVSPYKEMDSLSQTNKAVFIEENDKNSWFDGIEKLILDANLRNEIGLNARRIVEDHFNIDKKFHLWIDAYKEAKCQLSPILK